MNDVVYWYTDDSFVRAETELRRAIGQYASRNAYIYIGLTQQQPESRFGQHQRAWAKDHKWDRMIVIYHARSLSLMCTVEDRLISYAEAQVKAGNYDCTLINDRDSQAPMVSDAPDGYWIYILVQKE